MLSGILSWLIAVLTGEGCSSEGGCASCPFMKMNTLAALKTVATRSTSAAGQAMLEAYKPHVYAETVGGRSIAKAGCEPILHMRAFQKTKVLPADLIADIARRHSAAA